MILYTGFSFTLIYFQIFGSMTFLRGYGSDIDKKSPSGMCTESVNEDSCQAHNDKQYKEILLIKSIIDLDRYPIHKNGPEFELLVGDCQKQLKAVGSVDLPGFIRMDVIEKMAMEVDNLPSFNRLNIVSPYGASIDDEPTQINVTLEVKRHQPHPSKRMFAQDTNAVAADQIPKNSLIRKVYDSWSCILLEGPLERKICSNLKMSFSR